MARKKKDDDYIRDLEGPAVDKIRSSKVRVHTGETRGGMRKVRPMKRMRRVKPMFGRRKRSR